MYVNERGSEIFSPRESAAMLNQWRASRNYLLANILKVAADAEQRGWGDFAEKFLDLAVRLEGTALNELYYWYFRNSETYYIRFEVEYTRLLGEWQAERRKAGMRG